jgi:hypothetical protein
LHVAVTLHLHELFDRHRARASDAAHVVAGQVDEHRVLGPLLLAGDHLLLVGLRLGRRVAQRARAGDRVRLDLAVLDPDEHLGRGAEDVAPVQGQEEHVRAGVDRQKVAVGVDQGALVAGAEGAREHGLEAVAGLDGILQLVDL